MIESRLIPTWQAKVQFSRWTGFDSRYTDRLSVIDEQWLGYFIWAIQRGYVQT